MDVLMKYISITVFIFGTFASDEVQNPTSEYNHVFWNKDFNKWEVQFVHNTNIYNGGYFENDEAAAVSANLFCDRFDTGSKNPIDEIQRVTNCPWNHIMESFELTPNYTFNCDECGKKRKKGTMHGCRICDYDLCTNCKNAMVENPTSKLLGVSWNRNNQAWLAQLQYNEKRYCCGLFDFEEHARNYINCKCDALGIPHQSPNPTIEQKWKVQLIHNNNIYYDGVFNDKKNAVISANLLCDKCEIECKNLTIYTEPNVIQRLQNRTSKYIDVFWNKTFNKWEVQFAHNEEIYYPRYCRFFELEKHAAMMVNLLCEEFQIEHKNPNVSINTPPLHIMKHNQIGKEEYAICRAITNEIPNAMNEIILHDLQQVLQENFSLWFLCSYSGVKKKILSFLISDYDCKTHIIQDIKKKKRKRKENGISELDILQDKKQ